MSIQLLPQFVILPLTSASPSTLTPRKRIFFSSPFARSSFAPSETRMPFGAASVPSTSGPSMVRDAFFSITIMYSPVRPPSVRLPLPVSVFVPLTVTGSPVSSTASVSSIVSSPSAFSLRRRSSSGRTVTTGSVGCSEEGTGASVGASVEAAGTGSGAFFHG